MNLGRYGMARSTEGSAALAKAARLLMPGGVSSPVRSYPPYPRFITKGKGSRIWDVDGNPYLDLCLGFGPLLLGHAHPAVVRAVTEQVREGSVFGAPCEEEVWVAKKVQSHYPSMEKLRFVSTGGEAATSLLRLARAATGRNGVIKMDGGFHGSVDQLLVKAGSGAATRPSSAGVVGCAEIRTHLVPFNDLAAVEQALVRYDDIGLLLVEPALGNMGLILPESGYLQGLRKMTHDHGVLLAFDEVITGFRASLGGAQGLWGIRPDLTMLGKVLGGGLPLAAYGGDRKIMALVAPEGPVYQAGTFSGNPLSLAASQAVLGTLDRATIRRVEKRTAGLAALLRDTFADARVDAQVPSLGSLFSIFFSRDPVRNAEDARRSDGKRYVAWARKLLDGGVFVPQSPYESLFLSVAHSDRDVASVGVAARRALEGT